MAGLVFEAGYHARAGSAWQYRPKMSEAPDDPYADARHYDLLAGMTAPGDLDFYRRLFGRGGGRLLEFGCGTGRLTLPLCACFDTVVGVDRAEAMLAAGRARAALTSCAVRFVRGDFLSLELGERFDRILLPYNVLNHVHEAPDLDRLFEVLERHLAPRGRIVVDTFQPDPRRLSPDAAEVALLRYRDPDSGRELTLYECARYDAARQVNELEWRYREPDGRVARCHQLAMRVFFPQVLDDLFAAHGLLIEAKYGDYDGSAFGSASPKQIVVATRRDGR